MCSWESFVTSSLSSATFTRRARTQLTTAVATTGNCTSCCRTTRLLVQQKSRLIIQRVFGGQGGRIAQMAGWRVRLPHTVAHTIATWNPTLEFLWQRWELVGTPKYQRQAPFKHNDGSKRCSVAVTCGWEMWDKYKIMMKIQKFWFYLFFSVKLQKPILVSKEFRIGN